MNVAGLQTLLRADGFDPGPVDGLWGPRTRKALMTALRGDPIPLSEADIAEAAEASDLTPAHIKAVLEVESGGRGLDPISQLPIILYEPHVFSRLTGHGFDVAAPEVSYRLWRTRPYPRTQEGRYEQLMTACGYAPGPALQSASWGLFQLMGFNFKACGFDDVWAFVKAMRTERAQLGAFIGFLRSNRLLDALRGEEWAVMAAGYNGPGYAANKYDQRLSAAFRRHTA